MNESFISIFFYQYITCGGIKSRGGGEEERSVRREERNNY
jgi:hypothetical protein